MRIALFTETFLPKIDGVVTRLLHTVKHLQRSGDQVLVFCPERGLTEYNGAKIHGLSWIPFPFYPELKMAVPRPSIRKVLLKFRPDIVHAANPAILGVGGIYYAKKMNIPLICSYHTHLPKYFHHYGFGALETIVWKLIKLAHNKARLNLCTSTAMVNELQDHGIQRVELWQRGVDTEMFQPRFASETMRSRLSHGKPHDPILLYVGRLAAEKEIERIRPVLEAIPEVSLALVGNGPHRKALERHFRNTRTNFVGYLQGRELASAFASADAFILPSRTETLGLVLLEAMAAGCPPVAANSGGIPDIVTDGANGYLFEPDDPAGAVRAMQRLLYAKEEREALRRNARIEAEKWDWAAATAQLHQYYRSVINGF